MGAPKLEIITGEVVNVQLTTESHVKGGQAGKRGKGLEVSTTVVNRMRIFLRGGDGQERDYSFANCSVGVRDGHTVSIVRARRGGRGGGPLTIMLRNHSTGQQEEFGPAMATLFARRPLPAHWKALAAAVIVAVIVWAGTAFLTLQPNPLGAGLFAGVIGFLCLRTAFWVADMLGGGRGAKDDLARLRAEIETRTRPFDRIEG